MKPSILSRGTVNETVASLLSPAGVIVTPLGVWPCGPGEICARVYPGTRLRSRAEDALEACLAAPQEPRSFIEAVLGSTRLEPATALHAPCPDIPGVPRIEAVVASRARLEDGSLLLRMQPVAIRPGQARAYTRLTGATVELLVEYTRAVFFARRRRCAEAAAHYLEMLRAQRLIEHLDRGANVAAETGMLLAEAEKTLLLNGCPPNIL